MEFPEIGIGEKDPGVEAQVLLQNLTRLPKKGIPSFKLVIERSFVLFFFELRGLHCDPRSAI
jgi:hypothetical protein